MHTDAIFNLATVASVLRPKSVIEHLIPYECSKRQCRGERTKEAPSKSAVFDLNAIAKNFPATSDTMLIDTRLTDETAASSRVFRVYTPFGAHYHATCDEYLIVLSGRARFFLGDQPPFEARPRPAHLLQERAPFTASRRFSKSPSSSSPSTHRAATPATSSSSIHPTAPPKRSSRARSCTEVHLPSDKRIFSPVPPPESKATIIEERADYLTEREATTDTDMIAEIIAVGSEMLTPFRQDTNSLYLTAGLNDLGVQVAFKTIVGDNLAHLTEAARIAIYRADIVLFSGGLGPTEDDLTREAAAAALGIELRRNPAILTDLYKRFAARKIVMPPNNAKQADILVGATVLENSNGSAPGQYLDTTV